MRLRPALMICVIVALVTVAVRLLFLASAWSETNHINRQRAAVEVMARDAAGLLVLTQDYALHRSPRAARQWGIVHRRLSAALADFAAEGTVQNDEVNALQDIAGHLPMVFDAMKDALVQAPGPDATARREMLIDLLVGETRRISDGAFDVSKSVTLRRQALALQQLWVTALAQIILIGVTLILAWLLLRRVLGPIDRLRRTAGAVRDGDLTVRIDYSRSDELGQLANDFDSMTSRLAQRETALQQATLAAQAASEAKTTFLAHMSHEIRTPLNAVLGLNYLLALTPLDAEQRRLVDKSQSAGRSLIDMINDILDLSKIEADELELETAPFDLHALLSGITGALEPQAQRQGIDLTLEMAQNLPSVVIGDGARLRQIVNNLVGNAIKFTLEGGVRVIAAWSDGTDGHEGLHLSVVDTGIGMSAEVKQRLFKPFAQGDVSITRRFGGTGLGLAIVKRLVELMNGDITASSVSGKGSCFEVRLPLRISAVISQSSPIAVLIAEDEGTQREGLVVLCHQLGWHTRTVGSSKALISQLQDGTRPDVLLVDWKLGDDNGLQIVSGLGPKALGLPCLVMVSANDREAMLTSDHATLADQVLDKPVEASQLFDAVHQAVARRCGDTTRMYSAIATDRLGLQLLAGTRLLVADDSEINLEVAQGILKRQGAEVTLARNGAEALACLRAGPAMYDAVLMDVQMPVLDGLTAARAVRGELGLTQLPLIACTAGAMLSERQRALDAGMDAFVSKPFEPGSLTMLLRQHIERVRATPLQITMRKQQLPEQAPTTWPLIDGIDSAQASSRLQGDTELFSKMLHRFCEDFGDLASLESAPLTTAGNAAVAARMHNLAGSAGLLGADVLHRAALAAEKENRNPTAVTSMGTSMAGVANAMRHLLDASQTWRDASGNAPEPSCVEATSRAATPAEIASLSCVLIARELAALDRFAELSPALREMLTPAQFKQLATSMDRLEFETAQQILDEADLFSRIAQRAALLDHA